MKRFSVVAVCLATLELDDNVIDVVDDEWRQYLYNLTTPEQIAGHIAFNMIANRIPLSAMDGWADQPDTNANIIGLDWEVVASVAKDTL